MASGLTETTDRTVSSAVISRAAMFVLESFDNYLNQFHAITRRAKEKFERRDWQGRQRDSLERLELYDAALDGVAAGLMGLLGPRLRDPETWTRLKNEFAQLMEGRTDIDLAETFYNSTTRKVLETIGLNRAIEFFHEDSPVPKPPAGPSMCRRYQRAADTVSVVRRILNDLDFSAAFENLERDSRLAARELDLYMWPICGLDDDYTIEIIRSPFYRNKVAYVVGRIRAGERLVPLVLPLYNGPRGILVDTALLDVPDVSIVFSFAFSYFHVEVNRPGVLVDFISSILPQKPLYEIYNSIGFNRHGKTVFYRDLHRFVHESREEFTIAPGLEGAVMIVFTLPHYSFVFKVIKDRPCFLRSRNQTPKTIRRSQVVYRYNFVRRRDRVGRLVDTQEFENLRFKKMRFAEELLDEFRQAAREDVTIDADYVVVRHLYVQRRVVPLPMYLQQEPDPEAIRKVILDFGYFIKDLAATGIFAADLFNTWNYGVTQRGRVVLFDYDDVIALEKANFKEKPELKYPEGDLEPDEDWILASPEDFFVDEMNRYSGIPGPLREVFNAVHSDLYSLDFWRSMKQRVKAGEVVDITPYDRLRRFHPAADDGRF